MTDEQQTRIEAGAVGVPAMHYPKISASGALQWVISGRGLPGGVADLTLLLQGSSD